MARLRTSAPTCTHRWALTLCNYLLDIHITAASAAVPTAFSDSISCVDGGSGVAKDDSDGGGVDVDKTDTATTPLVTAMAAVVMAEVMVVTRVPRATASHHAPRPLSCLKKYDLDKRYYMNIYNK